MYNVHVIFNLSFKRFSFTSFHDEKEYNYENYITSVMCIINVFNFNTFYLIYFNPKFLYFTRESKHP